VQNGGVDVASRTEQRRHPFRLAGLVLAGAVVVLVGAAVILVFWLRSYAPLDANAGSYAPGPGLAADVEPVMGSGGKPVFIPAYRPGRPFDTVFTLHNDGRFAVTVLGLDGATVQPRPEKLFSTDAVSADPGSLRPFESFRLDPDETALVVVRWHLACATTKTETSNDAVDLRYRYLSHFTRTQRITLPFAVTLRCGS
jgi:hypothetical protein